MPLRENDRKAMMALIEQWQKSGLRQKDFYQQHNIPAHVFYYAQIQLLYHFILRTAATSARVIAVTLLPKLLRI